MNCHKFKTLGIVAIALSSLFFQGVTSNAATVYDLATDWSDAVNPNGPWSYNGVDGLPLPVHRDDWDSQTRIEHFNAPQPAWSATDASRSVPMAFKSVGVTAGTIWNLDAPLGKVGMHGQPTFSGITWTSQTIGIATITGDIWRMRNNTSRAIDWKLTLNGSILTEGTLTEANPYTSASPFDFADGTGGPSALVVAVMPGDVIGILAGFPVEPFHSDFVGVDLAISVVPEPATFSLLGISMLVLGTIRLRRRRRVVGARS